MALTEEQEKNLLAGLDTTKAELAKLAPLAAEVPALKTQLAEKDAKIAALESKVNPLSVNSAALALKTAYPDVPDSVLLQVIDLPAEKQKAILAPAQARETEFKAKLAKTDPMQGWADAGSIEAATDAERQAREVDQRKGYEDAKKDGNPVGMLGQRSAEIAAFVRKAITR